VYDVRCKSLDVKIETEFYLFGYLIYDYDNMDRSEKTEISPSQQFFEYSSRVLESDEFRSLKPNLAGTYALAATQPGEVDLERSKIRLVMDIDFHLRLQQGLAHILTPYIAGNGYAREQYESLLLTLLGDSTHKTVMKRDTAQHGEQLAHLALKSGGIPSLITTLSRYTEGLRNIAITEEFILNDSLLNPSDPGISSLSRRGLKSLKQLELQAAQGAVNNPTEASIKLAHLLMPEVQEQPNERGHIDTANSSSLIGPITSEDPRWGSQEHLAQLREYAEWLLTPEEENLLKNNQSES
jgi:hypothetical protein